MKASRSSKQLRHQTAAFRLLAAKARGTPLVMMNTSATGTNRYSCSQILCAQAQEQRRQPSRERFSGRPGSGFFGSACNGAVGPQPQIIVLGLHQRRACGTPLFHQVAVAAPVEDPRQSSFVSTAWWLLVYLESTVRLISVDQCRPEFEREPSAVEAPECAWQVMAFERPGRQARCRGSRMPRMCAQTVRLSRSRPARRLRV